MPDINPDDVVCLTWENINSLSLFAPHQWKVKKMCNLNNKYQSDGTMLVETVTNWTLSPVGKKPNDLFAGLTRSRIEAAHNKNDQSSSQSQHGGTAVATFNWLSGFVLDLGQDTTSLGRWLWIQIGTEGRKTRIISAYQPVSPS